MVNRENLIYKANYYIYTFQQFETIRPFAKNIRDSKFTINNAGKDQDDLLHEVRRSW